MELEQWKRESKRFCLICNNLYESLPIVLPCGQLTCEKCLEGMFIYEKSLLRCPLCDDQTHLVDEEAGLKPDQSYADIVANAKNEYYQVALKFTELKLKMLSELKRQPKLFIADQFSQIRNEIDIAAEEMILQVNKIRESLIERTNEEEERARSKFSDELLKDCSLDEAKISADLNTWRHKLDSADPVATSEVNAQVSKCFTDLSCQYDRYRFKLLQRNSVEFRRNEEILASVDLLGSLEVLENIASRDELDLVRWMNKKKWWKFRLTKYGDIYENKELESKESFKMMVEQHEFPVHVLDRLLANSAKSTWLEKLLAKPSGQEILAKFICWNSFIDFPGKKNY